MSSAAAQLRFGAEFTAFLVALAGAATVAWRPALVGASSRARPPLVGGFAALAAAAFLHGSLVVSGDRNPGLFGLRGVAIVLLALGTLGWRERPSSRKLLWAALVLLTGAVGLAGAGANNGAEWALGAGAVVLGSVLFAAGRRSISARVAVSAIASVLVVVLAVSVALSNVIGSNIERNARLRLDTRARTEATAAASVTAADAVTTAGAAAAFFSANKELEPLLLVLRAKPVHDATIEKDLAAIRQYFLINRGPLIYVSSSGFAVAADGISPTEVLTLTGLPFLSRALDNHQGTSSVEVVGGKAVAVGVQVVQRASPPTDGSSPFVGAMIAVNELDAAYLGREAQSDPTVALTLVAAGRPVAASSSEKLPADVIQRLAAAIFRGEPSATATTSTRLFAARPLSVDPNHPVLAVIASTPSTEVDATRSSLFRKLFVVALATALLGLLLSVLVGERIGSGLRRLTVAAESIQQGDLGVRTAVSSEDEVGVLSAAFDSMAGSIQSQAAELREAAADEARLRNRLEAVVAGVGEALVAVDADGLVTTFNQAAADLFGVSAARAVGRPIGRLVKGRTAAGDDLAGRLGLIVTGTWSAGATVDRPDGADVPVALSAGGLIGPDGESAGAVFVLRDLRREREVERMKTEFLSNISHELRTPLTPIKGYAEMLRARDLPRPKSQEFLGGILDAADRLERIVDLLVSFATMEAGRLVLRSESLRVRDVLAEVSDRWSARTDDHHPLRVRVARNVGQIVADRRLLERSLDELVDNAVKYSPNGGQVLVTAALAENGGGPAVEIAVRDHGVGIPPDRVEGLFEGFAQLDGSATREFGGLGLGLAFVRRIARAHDGDLRCQSVPGKGSVFSILLPLAPKMKKVERVRR